ncbi:transport and Golgi organization protein 1 homolog isoform X1 [Tachysurus ichikawai]
MTGLKSRFNLFILFICVCFSKASVDRRFSDFKRCADDDCSMLLCRGKASKDFPGPDCRFLSFKTGETIYVYYKLSGQRSDIWAGSVGNNFGYFPKDFLNINHIYTEKEIEVPAEETDFVCFDTGLDKFENYDVDVLLQNSALNEVDEPSDETEELSLSEEPAKDGETQETIRDIINSDSLHTGSEDEHRDDSEDHDDDELRDSETATLASETTASYEKDKDGDGDSEPAEGEGADGDSEIVIPDEHLAKDNGVFEKKTDHITPVETSQLKTTLGETFDAVTSDDEKTQKVTPHDDDDDDDEDQSNDLAEKPIEVEEESLKKPSLLTFEEKSHYLEDDVPDAAESEDEHVTLQKGEMTIGDEATKDGETGETSRNVVESDLVHTEDVNGGNLQDSKTNQLPMEAKASYDADYDQEQFADNVIPDEHLAKDNGVFEKKSNHTTPVEASSQLKTTLGETFDAVISDDKYTQKVTPHDDDDDDDDDQSNDFEVEEPVELEEKSVKKPSLLTFDEKSRYSKDNIPDAAMSEDKQPPASVDATKDDNMWSNFGDTVFKIVSGGERTDLLEDDDDDDDDDDKEEEENTDTKTTEKDVVDIKTISVHDSETTEEMKPSINDSVKEDSQYSDVQEQNPDVLKYNKELEEIKGKSLEPNEMLINGVESESIPPTSLLEDVKQVLDKPTENFAEKTILKPNPREIMTQTSEALVREHALDEQIHRVKNEIISVFEGALETEKLPEEPDIEEEEEEHAEELLEDENALLSTKTELSDEEESIKNTSRESQLEENELSPPKQPHNNSPEAANKNMSEQKTSHDVKSDPKPTLTSISDSATDNGNDRKSDRPGADPVVSEKPEYSDRVRRLTLLREHFKDDEIERILRHLSVRDLYRIEAMFNDLDHQLQSARQSYSENSVDLENALESILEVSENAILNEINKMLDAREQRALDLGQQLDQVMIDEEAAILDDFQELAFSLHQKYSASVLLVKESQSQLEMAENVSEEVEIPVETIPLTEVTETPEAPHEAAELFTGQEGESHSQDVGPGEDAGHFNKNEDNQAALQDTTDIQRGPQAILENPLDVLGFEIDPSSDSLDSSRATDFFDNNANYGQASTSTSDHARDFFLLASEFFGVYAEIEEMERHEKESKLSEVDGRALQAEEELNRLRQKVKEMQEEMQQNERSLKAEIAVQEKKAHENWIKARASERSLTEERRECANLRQKIVECSDKMSDLEHALYKSGPPDRHMPPVQRADSYGPSPVSGGAPSPPLMMEDPGRPPSGSIGRRSEPFGPRQLLDNHGRSGDFGHPLPFRPEMSVPRTSSPCTQDGSQNPPIDAQAEVTVQAFTDPTEAISQKSQRQGSFLPSPIRDSPVPAPHILPKAYGPQPMGGPLPPMNGPLPPAMRPPNGHSPMMHPGRHFGPEHPFRPPHMDSFRPPFPLRPYGPIPAPFVHGPPRRDFPSMGPHPPSHGIHDFPPNFGGPQDLPFQPRPFLPGPPGATVPPSVGAHGPAPPTPLQPREGQEVPRVTNAPPEQMAVQHAPTSTVTES